MDYFNLDTQQVILGRVLRVHDERECQGRAGPCCIHRPSDHHMRTWPMHWSPIYEMQRQCPHGEQHPDPDHVAYLSRYLNGSILLDRISRHEAECDGCCQPQEGTADG
jgi:hypothetical protein